MAGKKEKYISLSASLRAKEAKLLKKSKYIKCPKFMEPQPFRFIFRDLSGDGSNSALAGDLNNWFFTMGDYDVV